MSADDEAIGEPPEIPPQGRQAQESEPREEDPKPSRGLLLKSALIAFDKTFRNVWFYVAALSLVTNLYITVRPQLQVQANTGGNGDPLGTFFTLTNTSPGTFYDVHTQCDLYLGIRRLATAHDNIEQAAEGGPLLGPTTIDVLRPGEPATRDCGMGGTSHLMKFDGLDMSVVSLKITITYKWFFGRLTAVLPRFFDTREVTKGVFILVPDVVH